MSGASKRGQSLHEDTRGRTIYSRILDRELPVHDAREEFARPVWRSAQEKSEIQAFLANKRRIIQSHPQLTPQEKKAALAEIDGLSAEAEEGAEEDDPDAAPPPPGGVGYGIFYKPEYKVAWETGSAIELYIVCPTVAGGNVSTWLYLTATNRTAKGVEAFVSYYAQDEFRLTVFDWARPERWQVDGPHSTLARYLSTLEIGGTTYQVLHVVSSTYQSGESFWTNEVYLLNATSEQADLIYSFEYPASAQEQKTGWIGSWGPIIETFQDRYLGTHQLGFAHAKVVSRDASFRWGELEALNSATSLLQEDDQGFSIVVLAPNHTLIVES
jgi:hypothetical protein